MAVGEIARQLDALDGLGHPAVQLDQLYAELSGQSTEHHADAIQGELITPAPVISLSLPCGMCQAPLHLVEDRRVGRCTQDHDQAFQCRGSRWIRWRAARGGPPTYAAGGACQNHDLGDRPIPSTRDHGRGPLHTLGGRMLAAPPHGWAITARPPASCIRSMPRSTSIV